MSFDPSYLVSQLSAIDREEGDIRLKCQGEVVKAHSLILSMRSKYFETVLKTTVGDAKSISEMDLGECSLEVLTCAVNFMYGIPIPEDFADTQGLLHQADLFMMEDLKNAIGLLIAETPSSNTLLSASGLVKVEVAGEEEMDERVDVGRREAAREMDQEVLKSVKEERNEGNVRVVGKKTPFFCEIPGCGKNFVLKTGLAAHIKIVHNKERPYVCPEEGCGKSFGWKASLKGHIRIVHMQTKPFVCDKLGCSRKYGLEKDLERHIRNIHNREKPHICSEVECGKKFGLRASLKKHIKHVHQKEKPFQCEIPGCAKTFGFKSSLNVHIRIVHNKEMPYECKGEGCGKKFRKKRTLNLHINKVHIEMKPFSVPKSQAMQGEAQEDLSAHEEKELIFVEKSGVEPISKLSVLELKEANQEIKWLEMEVNAEGEALWLPLEKGGKPSAGSNYTEKSSEDANKILSKGLSTLEDEICLDEVEWSCSLGAAHKSLNTSFLA